MSDMQTMSWADVYDLWKHCSCALPNVLNEKTPVSILPVKWECPDSSFYGYDWRTCEDVDRNIDTIRENIMWFLYDNCSNRGTIHTASLLAEAKTEEEQAAIWIAATAFELKDCETSDEYYYSQFYVAARNYLRGKYKLWHHAMRKLVPELPIWRVLQEKDSPEKYRAMYSVCMNTLLLKQSHKIIYYSSKQEDKARKLTLIVGLEEREDSDE